MTTTLEHTLLPPAGEGTTLAQIAAVLHQAAGSALITAAGQQIQLPTEVHQALCEVVQAMAHGQAITIAPHDTVLTTQAAAELLGISRPTLVRLLEAGKIPFTQPGRHRRVTLTDLIAYQVKADVARRVTLDAMTAEAADDDLYQQVNGFIATR